MCGENAGFQLIDAVLVPIPKKDDFSRCDNWRGIKRCGRKGSGLGESRAAALQKLAEDELPE